MFQNLQLSKYYKYARYTANVHKVIFCGEYCIVVNQIVENYTSKAKASPFLVSISFPSPILKKCSHHITRYKKKGCTNLNILLS